MSIVENSRKKLEKAGEYVIRDNAVVSWFAVDPNKVDRCRRTAKKEGRSDFNLIVYRTKTKDERDHYVIPFPEVAGEFVDASLTHSEANGSVRWNCRLKDGRLHVSHTGRSVDVSRFHRARLVLDQIRVGSSLTEEVHEDERFVEGNVVSVTINRYERDLEARRRCISIFGPQCAACGFDFEKAYGASMEGFIHVHHLTPLHECGSEYVVDPETDLVPVCPNCHAVIHSQKPPRTIDQVRALLNRKNEQMSRPSD